MNFSHKSIEKFLNSKCPTISRNHDDKSQKKWPFLSINNLRVYSSASDKSESTADLRPLSSGARKCTSRKGWGWDGGEHLLPPRPQNISGHK
ncbi:hypothetical protein CEXT_708011 [Caerostris extrusa]|uniref:Uncharacterized protein n=1 Tax=Caerostris extrusa TaxID=172846 RepID=A0AAV4RRI7_CAEEX|nr:hypothetical protein CEXT_708011 [Caerostris extrusa]